ncbi:MAG: hypothetical protein JW876_02415 [Candidatus Krumholzibacteriota bacterium]|nr:hypothetical protein [Candidatus Krumholzibacteriota bacterium]
MCTNRNRHTVPRSVALLAALLLVAIAATRAPAAGWQTETRLTDDPAVSYTAPNNGKWLAVDAAGRLHVVWVDERDRNREIYHLVREGGAWSAPERLTADAAPSARPVLALDALGRLHLVWNDSRDGNKEIYHRVWNGSWGAETRVTETTGDSFASSIAADGTRIHLVYNEDAGGHLEIRYRVFDLAFWSAAEALTDAGDGDRMVPSLAVGPGGVVHVVWWDTREEPPGSAAGKIFYRRLDGAWGPEELVSDPAADAMRPSVAVAPDGAVHVAWIDVAAVHEQIAWRRRGPAGWDPAAVVTSGDFTHYHPSLDADGEEIVLVYWAATPSAELPGVFFRRLAAGAWSGELRISGPLSRASLCCLRAAGGGDLHVGWVDERDGNMEIYHREFLPDTTAVDEATWSGVKGLLR